MNKKFTLLKFLAVVFQGSEFLLLAGLVASLFFFPYATRVIESGAGTLSLAVVDGTPAFSFEEGGSGFSWGSLNDGSSMPHAKFQFLSRLAAKEPGSITFGRFRFATPEGPGLVPPAQSKSPAPVIRSLEGSFTFPRSSSAAEILEPVKWPFLCSYFCTGGITIAILELLSRMFRLVDRSEVFSGTSVRYAQWIGILFIVSSLLKGVAAGWLNHAMARVVMDHAAAGSLYVDASGKGDFSGLVTGLVILALAEVFRQGLSLKEESALTI